MLVTSKKMLLKAKEEGYAVIQPDFIDSRSARAFVKKAEELNVPIILSFPPIFGDRFTIEEAANIGLFYAKNSKAKVCLHLDHGDSVEICKKAIDLGFTSVMIDASSKPFEENVRLTKEVVDYAHERGVVVEAEIGHVGSNGSAEAVAANESIYTDVEEAKEFVKLTNCDSLAVSIGTSHGTYKGTPKLSFDRLAELNACLDVPLVLHGGSGTGDENLRRCAQTGITKINVFTDFLVTAHKNIMEQKPENYFAMEKCDIDSMADVLAHYVEVFGTKGEE